MEMRKCRDCGLLSVRDMLTSEPRSADERARNDGVYASQGKKFVAGFLCRANASNFSGDSSMKSSVAAVESINVSIDCGEFVEWYPAKTPREHEEMTIIERVRAENDAARQESRDRERWNAIRSWVSILIAIAALAASVLIKSAGN